jgi:glycosyltransferase involved in cell wall biosynthesis
LRNIANCVQLRFSPRVRRAARKAAAVLAASSTNQRDLARALGIGAEVLSDVGIEEVFGRKSAMDATDAAQHTPSPPAPLPRAGEGSGETPVSQAGELRVLWCGELTPRKALSLLIKALARLPRDVPYKLRVIGDGPSRARWERLARRTGVAAHMEMLGKLPRDQVLAEYRWANVFVFSSLRDTMGTVMLEALAYGVPVICLDHHGAHDVVTDECGIKVPVTGPGETIDGLCDALLALARDPDRRRWLSAGALERAEEYVWSCNGERLAAVYRRVLAGAAGRRSPSTDEGAPR